MIISFFHLVIPPLSRFYTLPVPPVRPTADRGSNSMGLTFSLQGLESDEQCRYEEQQGQCPDDHTAHDARTEGHVTVGAHTVREHQRDHTEYAGEDSHQDRAQTDFGCRYGGLRQGHSRAAPVGGILRDQNGGLREQADQHDDTRLQVDVVLQSQHLGEEERTQQAARYGEDDGERKQEALVQGTQDEVNQQNTDPEDDRRVAAGLCFLPGDTVEVVAVALRQYLGGRLLDGLDGIARRISVGCRSVHGDRAVHIETVQHFGAVYPLQIHELAQGSHFSAVGADEDVVERLGVKTVFRVGLDRYVVHFRETVDVRDVLPGRSNPKASKGSRWARCRPVWPSPRRCLRHTAGS